MRSCADVLSHLFAQQRCYLHLSSWCFLFSLLPEHWPLGFGKGIKVKKLRIGHISPDFLCAASNRSYQFLSILSLKLLMIHFMHRIPRVHHVIRSIILPSSTKRSKCYLHESSRLPFFLKPCLQTSRIYPPVAYRKLPIRDFDAPRFMFYVVYGFDLSDRIWLVCIVMILVVASLFGCVFSTIIACPSYIPFCLYRFPKRHMMCAPF